MAEVLAPSLTAGPTADERPHYTSSSTSSSLLRSSSSHTSLNTLPFSSQSRIPSPSLVTPKSASFAVAEDDESSYTRSSDSAESSPVYEPSRTASSLRSSPPSSLSLDIKLDFDDQDASSMSEDEEDENDLFPSYNDSSRRSTDSFRPTKPSSYSASTVTPPGSPDHRDDEEQDPSESTATDSIASSTDPHSPDVPHVADDSEAREEPSRHVDYLSHDWREEDIWCSWKHIVSRRRLYGERSRLENASWRTWAKQKNHLKTISPETLNWLKDCDVTWLYGPLQQGRSGTPQGDKRGSEPTSGGISKSNSFVNNKKPILKKRSASEVMLQKSLSSSSLVRQAATAVQNQRMATVDRPPMARSRSEFSANTSTNPPDFSGAFPSASSSGIQSPDAGRRHIRFDNKVEQCIAVEFKEGVEEEDDRVILSESSSEDDLPIMKAIPRRQSSNAPSSRNSFSNTEQKGIAMLPSTTLKFDDEEAEEKKSTTSFLGSWRSGYSLPSRDSQETLRPSHPSKNFLINGDEEQDGEEHDNDWQPSGAFAGRARPDGVSSHNAVTAANAAAYSSPSSSSTAMHHSYSSHRIIYDRDSGSPSPTSGGMRRTPSGMFMPYDEDEEESVMNAGLFGRVVDTVNTARDIAHVIWNVGWRK